jgi:hypothetical protein
MRSKNPYELRFDIFHSAQQRKMDEYYESMTDYRQAWNLSQEGRSVDVPVRPEFPTLDEVFNEAYRIKAFVEEREDN